MRALRPRYLAAVAAMWVAGCASAPPSATPELNIHIAASMAGVFTRIGEAFESRFSNVSVKFNFGGSTTLATQIQEGAPADIVIMADHDNIEKLVAKEIVRRSDIVDFAHNKLAILVPRGNPDNITNLADLTRSGLKVVLCDPSQPCGKYADISISRANLDLTPASREANASAVVARVISGEADAGISYVTDGLASGRDIDSISIPDSLNVVATYPLATVAEPSSGNSSAIKSFVEMARGPIGDKLLRDAGFELP